MKSSEVLDCVERWAPGMVLLREIGGLVKGRLDGLLVPVHKDAPVMVGKDRDDEALVDGALPADYYFERAGLVGVEVKVERSDWLRGLKEGQLQRYLGCSALAGLYVAAPRGVVKRTEAPAGVGLLTVFKPQRLLASRGYPARCVCQRAPAWRRAILSHGVLWRLLFRMHDCEVARERARAQAEQRRVKAINEVLEEA